MSVKPERILGDIEKPNVLHQPVKANNLNFNSYLYILYYQFIISSYLTFKFAWFSNIWNYISLYGGLGTARWRISRA